MAPRKRRLTRERPRAVQQSASHRVHVLDPRKSAPIPGTRTPEVSFTERTKSYFGRVARNDSTKHDLAAAGAGVILSLIIEALS